MGGKSDPPPPPDYSGIAAASEESARLSARVAREQLNWAREQYQMDREVTQQVIDAALARAEETDAQAQADRQRYEQLFQPLEQQLIEDASTYSTEARREAEAGRAAAAVSREFDRAREAAAERLEGYGVDPSQVRAGALDLSTRMQEAAARAGAANQARDRVDAMGRAMRSEAINVGRGYPGQIAGSYNTALQSGNQAVNSGIATTSTGASTMGTAPQYLGASQNALNGWTGALNAGYNNQMAAYNAQQQQNQMWGSALGGLGGMGLSLMTGGWFEGGGAVPDHASPSQGAVPDDVPARLQAGEFVIPEYAVRWHGEKAMHQLIQKAQKERQDVPAQTGAIPDIAPMPQEKPVVQSRGVLPIG